MNADHSREKAGPFGDPAPDILDGRIWVDGCWDFFHHGSLRFTLSTASLTDCKSGHAGAMLQARQLGTELVVGIHSDESILENKGPTVMTLEER
jgi:ethanolamine-phosphate cytidylyltransferase